MSFADKAAAGPAPKVPNCAVREVLEILPADEAEALQAMLDEPVKDRPHTDLAADLTDEGYPMSDYTVGRHRRLRCSCRLLVTS